MRVVLDPRTSLPSDVEAATLVGRAWLPGSPGGPSPVLVGPTEVRDLGARYPTLAELLAERDPAEAARRAAAAAPVLGPTAAILLDSAADARDAAKPYFLAPCDLQPVKACGVTFAASLLERVIEEHARGNPAGAEEIRRKVLAEIGSDLRRVKPGSAEAARLKTLLLERGLWSQ
jgi:fumarylacetoacetate (FAA) hydrolase family protein